MTDSTFVYDEGDPIEVGTHGEEDVLYHEGNPVPNTGNSALVYEQGTGIGGAIPVVWASDDTYVYELDYDNDFAILRQHSPSFSPHGAGGDNAVIWVGEGDIAKDPAIYLLDADDFSLLDSRTITGTITEPSGYEAPYRNVTECGGTRDRGFATIVAESSDDYEFNHRAIVSLNGDLTTDQIDEILSNRINATGGTSQVFWTGQRKEETESSEVNLKRRDPTSTGFTTEIETGYIEWNGNVPACGGSVERVYFGGQTSGGDRQIQERDGDLNVVRTVDAPNISYLGLGGM